MGLDMLGSKLVLGAGGLDRLLEDQMLHQRGGLEGDGLHGVLRLRHRIIKLDANADETFSERPGRQSENVLSPKDHGFENSIDLR